MKSRFGLLAAVIGVSVTTPAHAAYTITYQQVGSDVVATGRGSLDLSGLTYLNTYAGNEFVPLQVAYVAPAGAQAYVGSGTGFDRFEGSISGPANFGPGGGSPAANAYTGEFIGLESVRNFLTPIGYLSGLTLEQAPRPLMALPLPPWA